MIVVAGATGNLGSEICRRLRERGESVRALVRATSAPEKVARLEQFGCEIARGDLKDRASLDAACQGARTVISTVSIIVTAQPGDAFDTTDAAGNIALVDAAKAAGAEHVIFVSFDTAAFTDAPLPRAKRAVEEHLKASGLTYTILQATPFMEAWLGPHIAVDAAAGTAKVFGSGDNPVTYVSAGDVAEFAVRSVTHPAARDAVLPIGGPEPLSQNEAIAILEEAVGKKFEVTRIPEEALEAQRASAPDPFSQTFAALMLGAARGTRVDMAPVQAQFAFPLTSVRDYARAVAAQLGR